MPFRGEDIINRIFEFLRNLNFVMKKGLEILINHGPTEFIQRVKIKIGTHLLTKQVQADNFDKLIPTSLVGDASQNRIFVRKLIYSRFTDLQPIKYIKIKRDSFRFNMVTDSLKKKSLFGGVATSLILSTLYASRYNIPLRIITRTTYNNPADYFEFLAFFKINKPNKVEFYSDYDRNFLNNNYKLEVSDHDIFLSTSWWTSEAVKTVNLRNKFFYILQEDETSFYPKGDDHLLCQNILSEQHINYIINSKLLYDYYGNCGFENIVRNGMYFEPAFPEHIYSPGNKSFSKKLKYSLFFYSRPHNSRNLFYSGLNFLDQALLTGIVDKNEWDIYLAGADVPSIIFSNGITPAILGHMDWREYSLFLKTVDLGFCLMYSPHPSYPPLDIASSGGVVVTNKYLNKQSLAYSDNIICRDLNMKSILEGFEQGVELIKGIQIRRENYLNNNIYRKWEDSLEAVIEFIDSRK